MKFSIQQLSELVKKAKSEPTAEDLMQRPCCGSGCTNCPYSPKHKKGNTKVREELKKEAKIAKDKKSGKWILYTKDGSRILGKHENAQDAYKQEYAIQKSMEKKANPQKGSGENVDIIAESMAPDSASGIANIYTRSKQVAMAGEAAQIGSKPGAKRVLTKAGPLIPQLKAVGKVAQPAAAVIDTAMLVASPQARQNAVNEVEQDANLNPALRMTKAYVNPISTGYGIAAQTNEMVNSNNAALKSEQNYSNALDKRTTDAYYRNHYNQLLANKGLYTYPGTTRNQQNNAVPALPQPMPNQIVKRSFILVPGFSKQAEDGGPKSDQEVSIITKPSKTPRNGFIRDPKTNRLMVQDRRFNLVQPKEEVIKAANKNMPARVLKAVLNNDTKALSLFGKLGNKAKLDSKKSKAIMDAIKMEKHITHPDTQHFLSILDKENRLI